MVVGSSPIRYKLRCRQGRIRRDDECGLHEASSGGTHIGNTQGLLSSQSLLEGNIPLQRVGQFEIRIDAEKGLAIVVVGRRDGRRSGKSWSQRKVGAGCKSDGTKRVGRRCTYAVSRFRGGEVVEKTKPASQHGLPVRPG